MSEVLEKTAAPQVLGMDGDEAVKVEIDRMPADMVIAKDGFDGAFERRFTYIAPDLSLAIGTWESGPGTLVCEFYPSEEYCKVMNGVVAVTNAAGDTTEYGPGDTFILPKGWKGVWEMKTRFKKQFAVANWNFG